MAGGAGVGPAGAVQPQHWGPPAQPHRRPHRVLPPAQQPRHCSRGKQQAYIIIHLPKLTPISSPVLLSFTETYMQQGEDTAGADVAVSVLDGRMLLQSRTSQTGDALWVARSKRDPQISYALDYVVERKSVKDLVGSIKNGRYERQKYVLQRCGLRRVLYLMEGNPDVEVQGVGASTKSSSDLLVRLATMR